MTATDTTRQTYQRKPEQVIADDIGVPVTAVRLAIKARQECDDPKQLLDICAALDLAAWPNDEPPTLKTVARSLGLSYAVVHSVIRYGHQRKEAGKTGAWASEATAARIVAEAKRIGWIR